MTLTAEQVKAAEARVCIPEADSCWLLWRVKVATIERLWKQMAHLYFAEGTERDNGMKEAFCDYVLNTSKPITPPYVFFQTGPRSGAEFYDGCHRFAVIRESGAKDMLIGCEWGRARKGFELGVKLEPICDRAKAFVADRKAGIACHNKLLAKRAKLLDKKRAKGNTP